jgi:dual specificity protein kinase YAK1
MEQHHSHPQQHHWHHDALEATTATNSSANQPPAARHVPLTTPQRESSTHSAVSAQYEAYSSPSITTRAASLAISSPPASEARARNMDYHNGDADGDMPMEDADPYNKQKYARQPTGTSSKRSSAQYLPPQHQEDAQSRAAARYSPMTTSPTSSYISSPPQQQQAASNAYASYTPQQSARQSPTRQHNPYASPAQQQRYYASPPSTGRANTSQLPPLQSNMSSSSYYPQSATQQLNAVFGNEPRSPQAQQPQLPPGDKGPVPQFSKCHNIADLQPQINTQPPFRRANPEGGFISPLQALTSHLPATYRICNPSFQYESSRNPRRVLTKPSKGVKNDGYDNEDSDYILYVNDILGSEETNHKNRYLILDVLGQGTFGQVVKCQNLKTQEVVAVKVVKNKTAYFNQSMMEVSVLDLLNGRMDKNDDHHILRLKDTFIHRQHLCLVFELLSVNLYELIKQNQFRGLSTTLVRVFAQQLLSGLCLLSKAKLIHCDLKPENILLKKYVAPLSCVFVMLTCMQPRESHHQDHRLRICV